MQFELKVLRENADNVYKHEGRIWSVPFEAQCIAKHATTYLDKRIEVLAVAVPATFTIEY